MTIPFPSKTYPRPGAVASGSHSRGHALRLALLLGAMFASWMISPSSTARAQPCEARDAFPGAEGAGRHARGGRGGRIVRVTTLDDAGPGSLRAAIESPGARIIIFDVAGVIALQSPLVIRHGAVTVAGQSAPGDGIAIRNQPLIVAADDVVVRFIRARLGDESGAEEDAISVTRGQRIILDHVSASWSVDETLSIASRYAPRDAGPYDVTVQWSIISESLNRSRHAKGDHGYGTLVRGAHGSRITFHHNLWAHHRARNPRPGNYLSPAEDPIGPMIEFRSNVFYNWGGRYAGYNADKSQRVTYNFIDNAYVAGPDSTGALAFQEENAEARAYFFGNTMNGATPVDPWSLVEGGGRIGYRLDRAADVGAVRPEDAASAYDSVLAHAGASRPRDVVDARIVASVRGRTGRIIDSQADVGGWPSLRGDAPAPDADGDGMPDAWERARGLDPADASDGAIDRDGDGYTEVEDYLNSLVR